MNIINNLHSNNISTVESINFKTQHPTDAHIKHINWDDEIPSHYLSCRNLSSYGLWKYPKGIPPLPIRSTSQFDIILANQRNYSINKLPQKYDFTQLIEFDALCYIHSPGFLADNTIFNKQQFYGLTYEWMGHYKCWANKTMDFLCDTSLNTCSKQGTLNHIIIQNIPIKVINIAFRLTGWGAHAFSHFHIFIIPQFAMIYNMLIDIKKQSIDYNINTIENIFYNITIISNVDTKSKRYSKDIKHWFFKQFGLSIGKPVIITSFMNITIIETKSWCMAATNIHWSPLVISPHFIRYKYKYKGAINMRWKLLARNTMLNIKPFITDMSIERNVFLYLSRGSGGRRRAVTNNDKVINSLRKFISDNRNRVSFEFQVYNGPSLSRDEEKEYFSKVAIMIGPHGGAFANINLLQPGSYVVEFIDWWSDSITLEQSVRKKFRPCYYALAQGGGMNYYYLKPKEFYYDKGPMVIDVDKMIKLMNLVYQDFQRNGFRYM